MNACVSVVCYKSKTLSNGENPLMLQVSKGGKRKYQSLGISINPKYWDFTRNKPKPNCPNKEYIQKIILDKQRELQQRMLELNSEQKEYTTTTLLNKGLLAHFTQIYHLYNLLIYNILRRNLQLFITEFCIFSPCIIFISNKNSDKSIEILHISPKYITSVDNLMIHIFSSTFNFLYSFTPSDRLESKS